MMSNDLFKKLTCGIRFSSKNNEISKKKSVISTVPTKTKSLKIKTEIKEEELSDDEALKIRDVEPDSELLLDEDDIKMESEGDEDYFLKSPKPAVETFKLLNGVDIPIKKSKNKLTVTLTEEEINKQKHQQEINRIRNENNIQIRSANPANVPEPVTDFDNMKSKYKISKKIIKNLVECGYKVPTAVQMQAIPILSRGQQLMACAPTGSGKTSAFLVPILSDLKRHNATLGYRALILCPTRELAKQIQRECMRLTENIGIRTHIISKVKDDENEAQISDKKNKQRAKQNYDILITTPNRICFLLNHRPGELNLEHVKWFIIDEADKLFEDTTNSFRDQLDTIIKCCPNPDKIFGLFSATNTPAVTKWTNLNLKESGGYIRLVIGSSNSAVHSVEQELLFAGTESGKLLAFRDLVAKGIQPPCLVFVQSKDRAQQLFTELIYDGLNIDVIHSDRSQKERDQVVKSFREGKIWILICTELMGRGIDFKGVNLVINFDFPQSTISYIHRIGRTGRAGRQGKAITFFTKDDTTNLRSIAHIIKKSGGEVPDYMLKLKKSTKKARCELMQKAMKRKDIRTIPAFELKERRKRSMMIKNSKKSKKFKKNSE